MEIRKEEKKRKWLLPALGVLLILLAGLGVLIFLTGKEKEDPLGDQEAYWAETPEDPLVEARRSTVRVESGDLLGSGVILEEWEGSLILATASHVIQDGSDITVTFCDGTTAKAGLVSLLPGPDLAFLELTGEEIPEGYPEEILCATLEAEAYDSLVGEEYVFLRDGDFTNELGYLFAMVRDPFQYVEDFGEYMMVVSGSADPGMSGAGAFDDEGRLLGILVAAGEDQVVCVPLNVILTGLENLD